MDKTNEKIKVLIADDHPVTRAGITTILEEAPDIEVVGEARDGAEAKEMVMAHQPDVLLLDLIMPGLRPYRVEKWVRVNCPETVTLVLTAHDRDCFLSKAIEAKVAGYLTKDEAPHKLISAVRRAARGDVLLTPSQVDQAKRWHQAVGQRWEDLTQRERQVLRLLVQGKSNAAICQALSVTLKTAEYHVTNILTKLSVTSRQEAISWVHEHLPESLWDDSDDED